MLIEQVSRTFPAAMPSQKASCAAKFRASSLLAIHYSLCLRKGALQSFRNWVIYAFDLSCCAAFGVYWQSSSEQSMRPTAGPGKPRPQ